MSLQWYNFRQNNSGGSFDSPAINVLVQAPSGGLANALAETVGVYFDGCESGRDCPCCGDRWSSLWDDDTGTEHPTIYGESIPEHLIESRAWETPGIPEVMLVYADGKTQTFYANKENDR